MPLPVSLTGRTRCSCFSSLCSFCMEGREACIAIACALPYCGPGVQPVSVAGQCCPVCPTPQRPPHSMVLWCLVICLPVYLLVSHLPLLPLRAVACPDLSNLTTTCDLGCVSDEACEGSQICCSGGCSSVCVTPVLLTCPDASGKVGTCVESCSNSSQCQIGQLCCSNGCGHECFIADKLNCSVSLHHPLQKDGACQSFDCVVRCCWKRLMTLQDRFDHSSPPCCPTLFSRPTVGGMPCCAVQLWDSVHSRGRVLSAMPRGLQGGL